VPADRLACRLGDTGRDAGASWWQVYLHFTSWPDAENVAASSLAPILKQAEASGLISSWWFIRKHPCWRLRLRPGANVRDMSEMKAGVSAALDQVTADGLIERWRPGIYEPETAAFGGQAGIDAAHDLFHADSRAILNLPGHGSTTIGRRELSILLCGVLLRAAGLEWYEQGDVWHLVAQERPLPGHVTADGLDSMADDVTRLIRADTTAGGPLLGAGGSLAFAADWAAAFRRAGAALGAATRAGTLDRGIRHVLAYHVIFHWNRLGLPALTQGVLARATYSAITAHEGASWC
jgi:thiopeptide-type bacteriocin biosynthesis protein